MKGWIKIHRKIKKSIFYGKPDYMAVWFHLLLTASHEEVKLSVGNQIISLQPGQICTGRKALSAATGVTEMKCFRILKCLENEQQIEQQTFTKYSIISIVNWNEYQCNEQQNEQQMNNKRTTDEQQMNTNKKLKNEKNDKEENHKIISASGDAVLISRKKKVLSGKRLETFIQFWDAFDYKKSRAEAIDAWLEIPSLTNDMVARIVEAAKGEARVRADMISKGLTPKMAQGWISGRRWEDEDMQTSSDPLDEVFGKI